MHRLLQQKQRSKLQVQLRLRPPKLLKQQLLKPLSKQQQVHNKPQRVLRPLLKLLADGKAAQANLEYLAPLSLAVTLTPVPAPC